MNAAEALAKGTALLGAGPSAAALALLAEAAARFPGAAAIAARHAAPPPPAGALGGGGGAGRAAGADHAIAPGAPAPGRRRQAPHRLCLVVFRGAQLDEAGVGRHQPPRPLALRDPSLRRRPLAERGRRLSRAL